MKCTLTRLRKHCGITSFAIICLFLFAVASAAEPLRETSDMFPPGLNGVARYRIPGIVVTPKGTVLAYCEARRNNSSDWGEIEIHLRRSLVVVSMPDHPGCLSTVE